MFLIIRRRLTETLEDKQGERILGSYTEQPKASLLFWAPVAGRYTQLQQLPAHIAQNALSSSPSAFVIFSFCCISTGPHSSFPWGVGSPTSLVAHIPPICPPRPPLYLSPSSPGLQTVQGFIYILLVEARHVSMHVPVVVADVALCTPIGHRAKPEWW